MYTKIFGSIFLVCLMAMLVISIYTKVLVTDNNRALVEYIELRKSLPARESTYPSSIWDKVEGKRNIFETGIQKVEFYQRVNNVIGIVSILWGGAFFYSAFAIQTMKQPLADKLPRKGKSAT